MTVRKPNYRDLIENRFPGLIEEIRRIIEDSEKSYEKKSDMHPSFLWEHTTHVAAFSFQLAAAEKIDPLLPVLSALFHDAGKFSGGRYHQNNLREEETAAGIAGRVLRKSGVNARDVRRVASGLRALYHDKAGLNAAANVVHDADFLAKFGPLGVANFFIKSALRGRTLRYAVLEHLSKELTYAACLPLNMRTASGRKLAAKKAADSMKFFRSLLADLRKAGIADFRVRRIRVPHPDHRDRSMEIRLVVSPSCLDCGGRWNTAWAMEKSVKCQQLIVESVCRGCGRRIEESFCLPEILL